MPESFAPAAAAHTEPDPPRPVFEDWSRFVSFQPRLYFRPRQLDELRRFLVSIQQGGLPSGYLRVLGGLHSCSNIVVSDAILDISELPRTIEFAADNSTVTVSANWHLHDFLLALSRRGKSISATGGTDHQTLAGLISTDTAPATPRHALYDLLEWVEYVTIAEDRSAVVEKRVARTDPAFLGVVGSLGAIGVVTRVQFRLIDEPSFESVQKIIKLKDVLTDIAETSRKYEFWRIDWLPDTDEGLLWTANPVPHADPEGNYSDDQSENILKVVFRVLNKVESAGPLLDNSMRVLYAGLAFTYGETKASGPLRNILPVDRRAPLHVAMAEWSFDPADLHKLMDCCRQYYRKNGWPNLPIEIELAKTDPYWMSPWNWPGLEYIVKFNFMYLTDVSGTEPEKQKIRDHLQGLWEFLIQSGIPFKAHWGKINFMDHDFVRGHYQLEAFQPLIRPMFLNQYLADRLLPKP